MIVPFDLFRLESEDRMLWVSSASDFETAKNENSGTDEGISR